MMSSDATSIGDASSFLTGVGVPGSLSDGVAVATIVALTGAPGFGGTDAVLPHAAISIDTTSKINVSILIIAVPLAFSRIVRHSMHGEPCSRRSISASGAIWYDGRARCFLTCI
jgi:hypothetical protein